MAQKTGGWWGGAWARVRVWGSRQAPHRYLIALLVFYIILFFVVGFVFLYYIPAQGQPVPKLTMKNGTDVRVIAEAPGTVNVLPLKAPTRLNVTVYVIPLRNLSNTTVILGSNLSQFYASSPFKQVASGPAGSEWTARVTVVHSNTVQTINEVLSVLVVYHYSATTPGPSSVATETVNLPIKIVMSDFPNYFYMFILSLGVILSRVMPLLRGGDNQNEQGGHSNQNAKLSTRDLIWIPFSVVISLLIFTAFRQQVTLTTDIVTNFALAFGFGFAFDKALSSAPVK